MNGLSLLLIRVVLALVVLAACSAPAVAQEVVEYIHTDALGSPVAITDANGQVIERTVYEPYGAVVNRPLTDGPGYTGHVTDSETGLSYMQQRYYDPEGGSFLSVDPVSSLDGGGARYGYARSNPYRFVDPDGRCAAKLGTKICMNDTRLKAELTSLEKVSKALPHSSPEGAARYFSDKAIPLQEASGREVFANMEERNPRDFRVMDWGAGSSSGSASIVPYSGAYKLRAMLHTHPENNLHSGNGAYAASGKFNYVGMTDDHDIARSFGKRVDSYVARPDGRIVWFNQKAWRAAGEASGAERVYAGHFEKIL